MKKSLWIILILFLIFVSPCSPKPTEQTDKDTGSKTSRKQKHGHTDMAKKAACPICNARLLVEKGYKEISTKKFKAIYDGEKPYILINTQPFFFYRKEHILNSINMFAEEIELTAPKLLKKDALIIVYCSNYHCNLSTQAAEKLVELGYTNILDYKGGMEEWKEKGNKVSGLIIHSSK